MVRDLHSEAEGSRLRWRARKDARRREADTIGHGPRTNCPGEGVIPAGVGKRLAIADALLAVRQRRRRADGERIGNVEGELLGDVGEAVGRFDRDGELAALGWGAGDGVAGETDAGGE